MSVISLAATAQPANVPPRVKVDVTDTGTPNITSVSVVRKDAAGATTPVRTPDGGPLILVTSGSNRVGTVYDYEAPFGQPYTYSTVEYPAGVSSSMTLTVTSPWLMPLATPAKAVPITVVEMAERARDVNRGVFYPMGRANPIVVTDGRRRGAESTIRLLTVSDAERVALNSLLDAADVLFLNMPAGKAWGVDSCYIAVDTVTESRPSRLISQPDRMWDLPYVVVDRPIGGQQATYTYADVQAKYATYQALLDANATYAAVLTP